VEAALAMLELTISEPQISAMPSLLLVPNMSASPLGAIKPKQQLFC
jgi:hypothetical protein